MKWEGHVALIGEIINSCRIFVENSEGKKPLGEHGVNRKIDGSILKK
jgi:hypothetical protein